MIGRHRAGGTTLLAVRRIVSKNPCLTLQEVGDAVGVSRERVRQLVKKDGLVRFKNARFLGKPARPRVPCATCGEPMQSRAIQGRYREVLHRKCARKVPCVCRQCGKAFELRESIMLATIRDGLEAGIYCSNRCKWDATRKHPDLTLTCLVCGVEFQANAYQRYKYSTGQRNFACPLHGREMQRLQGPLSARKRNLVPA